MLKQFLHINLSFIFCLFATTLPASTTLDFEKGNQAFQAGDYETAITAYKKILDKGQHGKALHYNLGNAYYKVQKAGPAILHLEKALLLAPSDEDIRYNLNLAKQLRKDEFGALPPFFLKTWWTNLRDVLSPTAWAVLTIAAFWFGVLGLVGWLLFTVRKRKKISFLTGWAALAFGSLCLIFSLARLSHLNDSGTAILMSTEQLLHQAPDAQSPDLLNLHEGTKVEVLDQINDWYEVRLINGEQGWLPMASLEGI